MKAWAQNSLLVLISVAVTFGLFVLGYELFSSYRYDQWKQDYLVNGDWYGNLTIPSANENLLWEYRPDSTGTKWDTEVRTNSAGFRDREHTKQREAGSYRVAFGGDSTTVGVGAEQEAIYVRRFEELAATQGAAQSAEAIAFAVDGYNALQVLELLRTRAPEYGPDEAIYVLCLNDFDFEYSSGKKIRFFRKPKSFFAELVERLRLRIPGTNYYEYFYRKNSDEVVAAVTATRDDLEAQGIRFRVALLPIFGRSGTWPHAGLFDDFAARLEAQGVPVIDLREAFIATGANPRDYAGDSLHMNAAGHQFAAGQFVDALLRID